jgi:hypothetical protein
MLFNRLFSLLNLFGHKVQRSLSHMRLARLALVGFVALSAVASSQTAFAAEPQMFTFLDAGSNIIDCGSFQVQEDYSIATTVIVFALDSDGNFLYGQAHQDLSGTFTNLTSGYSVPQTGHRTVMFDNRTETHKLVGLRVLVNIPGQGGAMFDAGYLSFSPDGVTLHGKFQLIESGDQLICAALS